ncbi:MAG: hypothetical protein HYY84_03270 [Deltaproteobacteria bacterium]|nr:hypothetical protein [Deltaproteobacteria bacterium]
MARVGALSLVVIACFTARAEAAVEIMKEADVKPGMKGYGLSVFKGGAIERFDVEVIGTLKNVMPKHSIILVRCAGQGLERTGIIAGMSGSPVYIDGKLIGAIAYGWGFSKDPVGGVTPIEAMLEEGRRPLHGELARRGNKRKDAKTQSEEISVIAPSRLGDFALNQAAVDGAIRPLATPVVMAGFDPRVVERLRPELANFGMMPAQGAGGGPMAAPGGAALDLTPGAAIGVQLMRGDLNMTGVGTVTHRDGNRVLAFGHPMFGLGEQYMPITTAWVHHVFAGMAQSFKMASPIDVVGSLTGDRQPCIVGEVGRKVDTIPVTVNIARADGSYKRIYKVQVLKHRLFFPVLARAAVVSAMLAAEGDLAEATYSMGVTIKMKGREPLKLKTDIFSPIGLFDPRAMFFGTGVLAVSALLNNPFAPVEIESVTHDISIAFKRDFAMIESVYLAEWEVVEGGTVDLYVVLRPIRGEPFTIKVPARIPDGLGGRDAVIEVAAGRETRPDQAPPHTLDDFIRNIREEYDARTIVATVGRNAWGVKMRGAKLEHLPRTFLEVLTPTQTVVGGGMVYNDVEVTKKSIGRLVSGRAHLRVRVVERKD